MRADVARRGGAALALATLVAWATACGGDDDDDARGTAGPSCGAILTACEGKDGTSTDETIAVRDCLDTARTSTDDAACSDKQLLCEAYCE